jgi:hypothetical protein
LVPLQKSSRIATPSENEIKETKKVGEKMGNLVHFLPQIFQFEERAISIRPAASFWGFKAL